MKSNTMIFSVMIIVYCVLMGFTINDSAFAEETEVLVYTKLPGAPEGLCIDSKNNLYATVTFTGELVKLNNDGTFDHIVVNAGNAGPVCDIIVSPVSR